MRRRNTNTPAPKKKDKGKEEEEEGEIGDDSEESIERVFNPIPKDKKKSSFIRYR